MNMRFISIISCVIIATSCLNRVSAKELDKYEAPGFSFNAIISGEIDQAMVCDTVRLIVMEDQGTFYSVIPYRYYRVPVVDRKFRIEVAENFDHPVYIAIDSNSMETQTNSQTFFHNYVMGNGDSIYVKIGRDDLRFSGRGAEKYECIYAMDTVNSNFNSELGRYETVMNGVLNDLYRDSLIAGITNFNKQYETSFKNVKFRRDGKLKVLEQYRDKLSKPFYQLLYTDVIASTQNVFSTFLGYANLVGPEDDLGFFRSIYDQYLMKIQDVPDSVLALSNELLRYVWEKERVEYFLTHHRYATNNELYEIYKSNYTGVFREKLLTFHLYLTFKTLSKPESLINEALAGLIRKKAYRDLLNRGRYAIEGAQAYNFSLPDLDGNMVSLSDFRGKVVFIDFYFKGCAGCKVYYQGVVSKVKEKYKGNPNVVFVAISIDKTREKWLSGIDGEEYSSRQAVNLNTGGVGPNHPAIENNFVIGYPTPQLIDKKGRIFSRNATLLGHTGKGTQNDCIASLTAQIEKALGAN